MKKKTTYSINLIIKIIKKVPISEAVEGELWALTQIQKTIIKYNTVRTILVNEHIAGDGEMNAMIIKVWAMNEQTENS